jgi:hypothetical protein
MSALQKLTKAELIQFVLDADQQLVDLQLQLEATTKNWIECKRELAKRRLERVGGNVPSWGTGWWE